MRTGQVMTGPLRTGLLRTGQVRTGHVRRGQVKTYLTEVCIFESSKKCRGVPGAKIGDGSIPESFITTQYFLLSMAEQFNLSVFGL